MPQNSHGFQITGRFFPGEGGGLRPTLILLPGWPGGTGDVLGLGGRLSDAGVNVLMVIPRGMQGSEGTNTFANTLEDIGAALAWLQQSAGKPGASAPGWIGRRPQGGSGRIKAEVLSLNMGRTHVRLRTNVHLPSYQLVWCPKRRQCLVGHHPRAISLNKGRAEPSWPSSAPP